MRKGAKMNYTRNHDPNFYEEYQAIANCGSFAFQVEEWYAPDDYFEDDNGICIEAWIEEGLEEGCSEYDLADGLAEILANYILLDFEDVRYLMWPSELQENEELIAFRTFVDDSCNWDFHFKVYRNGLWQEKCGSDPVRFCDEWDWNNGLLDYISCTFYFARKLES